MNKNSLHIKIKNIYKKTIIVFLVLLMILLQTSGCRAKKKARLESLTQTISSDPEATLLTHGKIYGQETMTPREDITRIFIEDFKMEGLVDHKVLIKGKIIETDFYFDEKTTRDSVKTSINFAAGYLNYQRGANSKERVPYSDVSINDYYTTIYSRVFYNDTLIYQQTLFLPEEGEEEKLIFEEPNIFLPFREITVNEDLNEFKVNIIDSINASDVTFERAIMHHVLIINIKTKNIASNSSINQIKRGIDMDLADRLLFKGLKLYSGYLLRFRMGNKVYYEEFYVDTPEEKKWYSVEKDDWMNHKYIFFQ